MERGLSKVQFWICFAVLLGLFLFWSGPVWHDPWDVDAAVFASYIPIPFMVLALLVWSRRFSWTWFFLDTVALTLLKFAVTYAAATAMWAVGDAPDKPTFAPTNADQSAPPEPPPPPTPVDPATTGAVTGVIVDDAGAPIAGAVVYIADGLGDTVFAAPTAPVVLEASAHGIAPRAATVQTWQPIQLRSTDRALHTIAGRDAAGTRVLNRAAPADGTAAQVVLRADAGLLTVYCRLHEGAEATATLGVFAHPFHAVTGGDGAFRFDGVPAGAYAFASPGATIRADVTAGDTARVELRVR